EMAKREAGLFGHDFIGTEHLLLGVLGSESSVLSAILRETGVTTSDVRGEIRKIVGEGHRRKKQKEPPFTPRAQQALRFAAGQAMALKEKALSPEHVFLGLLLEPEGAAGIVLKNLGLNCRKARAQILRTRPDKSDGPGPVGTS